MTQFSQLSFVLCLSYSLLVTSTALEYTISERSLINFKSMIEAYTKENALKFNNYGNWCGKGGSGEPVDELDNCCKTHDLCYEAVTKDGCKHEYAAGYRWCIDKPNNKIVCSEESSECGQKLCACDKPAVECFKNAPYNPANHKSGGKAFALFKFRGNHYCE